MTDGISSGAKVTTDEQPQRQPHIELGNLVAVDLPQYEEWPQIGKFLYVTERNIDIQQYDNKKKCNKMQGCRIKRMRLKSYGVNYKRADENLK